MALPYWISKENNKFYLHIKISQPAGSKRQYNIIKDSSYSPTVAENFWDFFDDFSVSNLNHSVWDDTNAAAVVKFQLNDRLVGQSAKINLADYTIIRSMTITKTGISNASEVDFYTLISRDNQNWYKWNGNNFVSVGSRVIDITDNNDLTWVKTNGVDISLYENAGVNEWNSFFGNQQPDQLYFMFAINYDSLSSTIALDKIEILADIDEYWYDDTHSHNIKYIQNTISIKFLSSGMHKINYSE